MKPRLVGFLVLAALLAACSGGPTLVASPDQPTSAPAPTAAAPTSVATAAPAATSAPAPTAASAADPTAAPTAGAYSITDSTGKTFSFEQPPERLICLYHECIELMAALGVQPIAILAPSWLPAFGDDPAYFPQPNTIVRLQPQESGSWDYEEIAALKPDLVFGGDEDRTALDGIAQVHSYSGTYAMTNQDTLDHVVALGKLLGREQDAEQAVQRFKDRLAAYAQRAPRDVSVMLVASDGQMAWLYAGESVPCSILNELVKCDWPNPQPKPGVWGYPTTIEALLQIDPDVIIFENWTTESNEQALKQLATNPLWAELKAFKSERIYPMQSRDAYGLGPVGGTRLLDLYVPLIYPDIFPQALSDAQVQEILSGAPAAGAYSITDSSGTTLSFDKQPERIACLYTRCLEVLATLGVLPIAVPEWIAPIAQDPAYFPQPNEIAVLAATSDDIGVDLEELAALKPDLVLGWEELRAPLSGIVQVHAVANSMDSYQESHDEIRAFAKLLGREEEVETTIQQFLDRLAAYKQRAPGDRSIIYLGVGEELSYRDGQSGTCNLLREIAGCDWPDPSNQDVWSVTTSIEGLLQLDPDVILVSDWAGQFADEKTMREELGKRPLWKELTAFREGRVFLEPSGLNLDGMGTIGAARMLDYFAPLIYPEVFPAPLTDEEVAGS